jgi:ribosomal protein S18 acetylase RimI-like enzyme
MAGLNFTIRPAKVEDAEELHRLHIQTSIETYKELLAPNIFNTFIEHLKDKDFKVVIADSFRITTFLVAEYDAKLIGFMIAGPSRHKDDPQEIEIYAIYISKEHQGNSIGKKFIQIIANDMWLSGYNSLIVWVLENNPCVRFYEKLGGVKYKNRIIKIKEYDLNTISYVWTDIKYLAEQIS